MSIQRQRLASLILAICVGPASVHAQAPNAPKSENPESEPPQQEVVVDPRAQDADIAARLERILVATGWFSNPRVSVREGVVFIDGTTISEERRDWAGTLARKTQDVVAVVNRLSVEPNLEWGLEPAYREVRSLAQDAVRALPLVLVGSLILIFAGWIAYITAKLARWLLGRRIRSPLLLTVVARAIAVPVFLTGLYLVLQVAGLTRLALTVLGGTGVVGLVLGFAFRDIAENFLASLLLSIRNPFRTGDLIRVGEHEGIVQNLNTRTTVLLTLEGNQIQVPNSTVYKSTLINYTSNPTRRAEFTLPIAPDAALSTAQDIIARVLRNHPAVCNPPEFMVLVEDLHPDRTNLKIYFWFDSSDYSPLKLRSALMRQCRQALHDAGIRLAPPLPAVAIQQQPSAPGLAREQQEAAVSAGEKDLKKEEPEISALAAKPASPQDAVNLLDPETQRRGTSP